MFGAWRSSSIDVVLTAAVCERGEVEQTDDERDVDCKKAGKAEDIDVVVTVVI